MTVLPPWLHVPHSSPHMTGLPTMIVCPLPFLDSHDGSPYQYCINLTMLPLSKQLSLPWLYVPYQSSTHMTTIPILTVYTLPFLTLMTAPSTMTATERSPYLLTANSDHAALTFQDILHANGILHFIIKSLKQQTWVKYIISQSWKLSLWPHFCQAQNHSLFPNWSIA